MKKIIVGILMLSIQNFGFAQSDMTNEVKNYLQQGKKTSFRFEDNSIGTVAYLIQHEKGIKVIFDKNIDTKKAFLLSYETKIFSYILM